MKIIFVAIEFVKADIKPTTGLPMYLYKMGKELVRTGNAVTIICVGNQNKVFHYQGIEIHIVAHKRYSFIMKMKKSGFNQLYDSITMSYQLNKEVNHIVKNKQYDIIQYASPYGLALFYSAPIPAVVRLSWYAKSYFHQEDGFYTKNEIRTMSFLERLAAKKVSAVFGPARVIARDFSRDIHRNVNVIETLYMEDMTTQDLSAVKKYGLEDGRFFLFMGRLSPEKGVFVIAEILPRLLQKFPDYKMVFIGTPVKYQGDSILVYMRNHFFNDPKKVQYIKALPHSQLYPIVEKAKLILLPSFMENFSNACLEAMAHGGIVIGTDGASYEQIITDGQNGFLAKPKDAKSLLHAIEQAMELSADEEAIIRENARKRIADYRPELIVERHLAYYRHVIESHFNNQRK